MVTFVQVFVGATGKIRKSRQAYKSRFVYKSVPGSETTAEQRVSGENFALFLSLSFTVILEECPSLRKASAWPAEYTMYSQDTASWIVIPFPDLPAWLPA